MKIEWLDKKKKIPRRKYLSRAKLRKAIYYRFIRSNNIFYSIIVEI